MKRGNSAFFPVIHENITKRTRKSLAHRNTRDLLPMSIINFEIVIFKN